MCFNYTLCKSNDFNMAFALSYTVAVWVKTETYRARLNIFGLLILFFLQSLVLINRGYRDKVAQN